MNRDIDEIKRLVASDAKLAEDVFDWHSSILLDLQDAISRKIDNPAPAATAGIDIDVQEESADPWDGLLTTNEVRLIEATRRLDRDVWDAIQRTDAEAGPLLDEFKMAIAEIRGDALALPEDPDDEDPTDHTSEHMVLEKGHGRQQEGGATRRQMN
jgi:hypothetical protein